MVWGVRVRIGDICRSGVKGFGRLVPNSEIECEIPALRVWMVPGSGVLKALGLCGGVSRARGFKSNP